MVKCEGKRNCVSVISSNLDFGMVAIYRIGGESGRDDPVKKAGRGLSLALLALLMLGLIVPALAADRAVATTLRLERAEGTVGVVNKSGKSITTLDGMKLYSGYKVATEIKSYGYISLDASKAVKLDAKSKAEVKQSGKQLEVDLKSGNLFFNVKVPVKSDESYNIRTSTMVTGITGTSGFIRVIDEKTSEIFLLSGSVDIFCTDPLSGETRSAALSAGQKATSYVYEGARADNNVQIVISGFTEEEVPGFVALEIKRDEDLQRQITEQTNLSVPKIIGEAETVLARDEQAFELQQQAIDAQVAQLENERTVDPLFEGTEPFAPTAGTAVPSAYTFDGPITEGELQIALNSATIPVTLGPNTSVTIAGSVTIPPGQTLVNYSTGGLVNNGGILNYSNSTLINMDGAEINGTGEIMNGEIWAGYEGRVVLGGICTNNVYNEVGTVIITGILDVGTDGAALINFGPSATTILQGGTIRTSAAYPAYAVEVTNGLFRMESGSIEALNGMPILIDGECTLDYVSGTIRAGHSGGTNGSVNVKDGVNMANVTNNFPNGWVVDNEGNVWGDISVGSGTIELGGEFEDELVIKAGDDVVVEPGGGAILAFAKGITVEAGARLTFAWHNDASVSRIILGPEAKLLVDGELILKDTSKVADGTHPYFDAQGEITVNGTFSCEDFLMKLRSPIGGGGKMEFDTPYLINDTGGGLPYTGVGQVVSPDNDLAPGPGQWGVYNSVTEKWVALADGEAQAQWLAKLLGTEYTTKQNLEP